MDRMGIRCGGGGAADGIYLSVPAPETAGTAPAQKDQKAQAKLQTEMSRMQKELYHERDIIGLIQEHMVEGILIPGRF
ncbi:hypothetical protein [Ruminococcus sp.]|uniref:hypothetical protein n=1 Tax=Ruminococcus sp. TaxID=41978 RepID=UPI00399387C5